MNIPELMGKNAKKPSGFWGFIASKGFTRMGKPVISWSIKFLDIQPDDHILEVGIGTGLGINIMADKISDGKIVGIDHSSMMVQNAAKLNAAKIKAGKVEVKQGDTHKLTFDDSTFDKALAVQNLYVWSNPNQALKELNRVLKPGGIFVAAHPAPDSAAELKFSNTESFNIYSIDQQRQMLQDAGFSQIKIEETDQAGYPKTIAVIGIK